VKVAALHRPRFFLLANINAYFFQHVNAQQYHRSQGSDNLAFTPRPVPRTLNRG